MQAIPSATPLSRTAFFTSSVMSVTVRPPAVRRRVSCWNTFIVEAILRESLPDSAVEPPHPQWILHRSRVTAVLARYPPSFEALNGFFFRSEQIEDVNRPEPLIFNVMDFPFKKAD